MPQTGQLNWPVPVMAIIGATLFITGWVLCLRKKRIKDEE
ncbi:MAG: LPXTG cell wall anchor domain-containing protein [Ruminococcaceae bacterium]|nr:LPXTG cell wall anchor domain-containing protein [Oscillospiraceae bacterium]